MLKFTISSAIINNTIIAIEENEWWDDLLQQTYGWRIDTFDLEVRNRLIELGWTPPKEQKPIMTTLEDKK